MENEKNADLTAECAISRFSGYERSHGYISQKRGGRIMEVATGGRISPFASNHRFPQQWTMGPYVHMYVHTVCAVWSRDR